MTLTQGPLICTVTVTHNGTAYNLANDLTEANPTLCADSRSGSCDIVMRNDSAQYGSPGNPLFEPGDTVSITGNKVGGTPQSLFTGYVQIPRYVKEYGGSNNKYMRLNCIDASAPLQWRFANTAFQTFNVLNPGYTIDTIVNDLLSTPALLMDYQAGINLTPLGITHNNVAAQTYRLQNITFSQQSVFSCISQLAQYANANFFVDSNNDMHFFEVGTVLSTVVLDDSLLRKLDISDDGTQLQSVLAVNGGTIDTVDDNYQPATFGTPYNTYGQYVAVQFRAGNFNLDTINLYLQKIQSSGLVPVNSLGGEIRTDNTNTPDGGTTITTFTLTSDQVSLAYTWTPISVSTTLVPGNLYWIILYAAGQNSTNHYNIGAQTNAVGGYLGSSRYYATSTTGLAASWTVSNSAAGACPAFVELVAGGILSIQTDPISIARYGGPRDGVWTDLTLPTFQAAGQLGAALLGVGTTNWGLAKKKRFLRVDAFPADTLIQPGSSVNVVDTDYALNAWFTSTQVQYNIKGMDCTKVSYQLQEFLY